MSPRPEDLRTAALAAGELDAEAAAEARAALADSPRLAALYGRVRDALRALDAWRRSAGDPPAELPGRIFRGTLPVFRRLYGRRSLWPTWLTAAAAAAVLAVAQPPPLDRISGRASSLLAEAGGHADRALAEWSVVRASLGVALEDGVDEVGERLQRLEEAARHRNRVRNRTETAP